MKIDLHCHTLKIKNGDPETRTVSCEMFAEKVQNADVKIVAITNHNTFDFKQYKLFREKVKDYCDVWPGVELDAYGDKYKKDKPVKFHIIIVSNPNAANKFSKVINKMLKGQDINTFSMHIEEVCKQLKNLDVLYIPHYMGKTPAISDDDLELLKELVGDETRVFTETTESSIGVLVNHDFHALVGSDVKDWSSYEESTFSELRLPVSSYEQFCLLSKRDIVVIDTILNQKKSYEYFAKPHSKVTVKLKLFEDVNIIFGQKGTGKSEIVNSLCDEMIKDGLKCVKYVGSQKEDGFKKLLSTSDMKRKGELLKIDTCEDSFENLKKWKESNITMFSLYLKWYQTKNDNANKMRMQITEAVDLPLLEQKEYTILKRERQLFGEIKEKIEGVDIGKFITEEETNQFVELISKIDTSILQSLLEEFSKNNVIKLTNYSVNIIKELADKKTDTVSKPSTTGFVEFAKTRLEIKKNVGNILCALRAKTRYEDEKIGELEGKGNIYIRKQYRMLGNESKAKEYSVGINNLKSIKNSLIELDNNFYKSDISIQLEELASFLKENNVKSTVDFIGISKLVVNEMGNIYEPSTGEKGILLLQQVITESADAYFFDEPEMGMGNSYIDTTIRPQIIELAKKHKVVVIATHNANLAVRTLPYMSIFRKYDNGVYYTYTGNPFRNELINNDDENDSLNWTSESMHTLEGGKEAFYERRDIYESGN